MPWEWAAEKRGIWGRLPYPPQPGWGAQGKVEELKGGEGAGARGRGWPEAGLGLAGVSGAEQ